MLVGDSAMLYIPSILSTGLNLGRTPGSLQGEVDSITKGMAGYLGQGGANGKISSFGGVSRTTYQGRGGSARVSTVSVGNDTLSGDDGNDLIAADYASLATPFVAPQPESQVGAFTAKLDIASLIRDFGQPLPGQSLTRSLVVQNTAITQRSPKLGGGTQGFNVADGGLGDDVLFGAKGDQLTDISGSNYVDTDPKQRQSARLKDGANFQLSATIRTFLQTLSDSTVAGKEARVSAPARVVADPVVVVADPTAGGIDPAVPLLDALPVTDPGTGTTTNPVSNPTILPTLANNGWLQNLLAWLRR